jgi:hypothetical protein
LRERLDEQEVRRDPWGRGTHGGVAWAVEVFITKRIEAESRA